MITAIYELAALNTVAGDGYWRKTWFEDGDQIDQVHEFATLDRIADAMRKDAREECPAAMRYYNTTDWIVRRVQDVVL